LAIYQFCKGGILDLKKEYNGEMINVIVMRDEGIVVAEPTGPLEHTDFEKLAKEIDAYSDDGSRLLGLIIHTKLFPGWDDFNAFLQHMKFLKEHHKAIQRIAIVTDSILGTIGPTVANPFASAQIKHFGYDNIDEAKQWIKKGV
jgi:hypothetical protein